MGNLTISTGHGELGVFLANYVSDSTKKAYVADLKSFFKYMVAIGQDLDPKTYNIKHLISFRDYLTSEGAAPKTVARRLGTLRIYLKWLHDQGVISVNPALLVKVPRVYTKTPTNALTDEEVRKVLTVPDPFSKVGRTHSLILHFLFMFGLRRSELIGIKLSDIYQVGDKRVLRVKGKGGKVRELVFSEELSLKLDVYLSTYDGSEYLFGAKSVPMDPSTIYVLFVKYCKLAGISKKVSPHSARATLATKALEANIPISQVSEDLGHSSIQTTQLYWKRRHGLDNCITGKIKY